MRYDENGREIPDPTKPEVPLGFKHPETLAEQVHRLVRSAQLREMAEAAGHESFEQADDFDIGEDYDPRSPYEEVFDPTSAPPKEGPSFKEENPMGKGAPNEGSPKKPTKPKAKKATQGSGGATPPVSPEDSKEESDE